MRTYANLNLHMTSPKVMTGEERGWFTCLMVPFCWQVLALGNQIGKVYVWDLDLEDPTQSK